MDHFRQPGTHLLIIGMGATGCALLPLVCTFPFTRITIVDGDTIEERNLPRQPLYGPGDIGRPKVEVAMERTAHLNVDGRIVAKQIFVDANRIKALVTGTTIMADCTDDLHARDMIDRTCAASNIPLITGAVHGTQLQVMTLHAPVEDRQPLSLSSFFPGRTGMVQDGCDMEHVPITATTLAAALMAGRIKALLQGDHRRAQLMDLLDVEQGSWMRISAPLPPDDDLIA